MRNRSKLSEISLAYVNLNGIALYDGEMEFAKLEGCELDHVVFENCSMEGSVFMECSMDRARLVQCSLYDSEFWKCELTNASFVSSNLTSADFGGSNLAAARFDRADIRDTDFSGCKNMHLATFVDAIYDDLTIWPTGFDVGKTAAIHEDEIYE